MGKTLALAQELIAGASVTPADGGCQPVLIERLRALDFHCETIQSGPVTNLWARRGTAQPLVVFAGHTDVVPSGPLEQWHSAPFTPTLRDGRLYGRGAADMKSSLAAMIVATEEFLAAHPAFKGSIAYLVTSDEEGPATDGTVVVVEKLKREGVALDYCIVGEPTSSHKLGDTVKNGRRGTLSGTLTIRGVQGHVAYPQLARNPIHLAMQPLAELAAEHWDEGNAYYLPTSWQMSNIQAGTGATNVIPGALAVEFNFRYSTENTVESLKKRVHEILNKHELEYEIAWRHGGDPFLTQPGELSAALCAAIKAETGLDADLSTTGGTSDGRFIARICPQVCEFGPPNASIHKIDEYIEVADLDPLKNIYRRTLENLLGH